MKPAKSLQPVVCGKYNFPSLNCDPYFQVDLRDVSSLFSYLQDIMLGFSLHKLLWLIGCLAALASAFGCDSDSSGDATFEPWIEEKVSWVEIELGDFSITVLAADDPTRMPDLDEYQDSVAIHFNLHCLVEPDDEEKVTESLETKKGRLSDEVIRTCRNANLIDLADPELRLVRAQLRDFSDELIGPSLIKRFVFTNVALERY
ncbi:hypothetical protein [Blastopirellula retiformator]|uniref:Flagellar protein FliL n=1 Tax=Blastopirellula retiformator TaxID=2527970 RepID=A0A5C5V568_9BACT|nr:hypothetical protein [Blastopirellula retiformator]TWT33123.1 hypothetical protein Enr8_29430 [Blastopirellula retiformator]